MPGHKIPRTAVKNITLFDKYQCPNCHLLLKNAVQPACGHWMCESCVAEILAFTCRSTPQCPRLECKEGLKSDTEEIAECFPDRFVRKEIDAMAIYCIHQHKGCKWEGNLGELEDHLRTCLYTTEECNLCGTILKPDDEMESHNKTCPKALVKCPLAGLGCSHVQTMTREDLEQHVHDYQYGVAHLEALADSIKVIQQALADTIKSIQHSTSNSIAKVDVAGKQQDSMKSFLASATNSAELMDTNSEPEIHPVPVDETTKFHTVGTFSDRDQLESVAENQVLAEQDEVIKELSELKEKLTYNIKEERKLTEELNKPP